MEEDTAAAGYAALPALYTEGMNLLTNVYYAGVAEGKILGRDEQAREHHQWLLSRDEALAQVAAEARREALLDAAEEWEKGTDLNALANEHYKAGGPSMPTIWLRLRAGDKPAEVPA